MVAKEQRRSRRISARVRVEFLERQRFESTTLDIGRNGILVRGALTRAVNSLVRMRLYLPPDQKPIEVFGKIVRKQTEHANEGLGIQFLELESGDRDRWIEYVSQVESLDLPKHKEPAQTQGSVGHERRRANRTDASFMVRFKTKETLDSFVTKNVSAGGMFLATPVLKAVGTKVSVVIVHPTTNSDFEIEAVVVRANTDATETEAKGMALEFANLTEERKQELDSFVLQG